MGEVLFADDVNAIGSDVDKWEGREGVSWVDDKRSGIGSGTGAVDDDDDNFNVTGVVCTDVITGGGGGSVGYVPNDVDTVVIDGEGRLVMPWLWWEVIAEFNSVEFFALSTTLLSSLLVRHALA